MIAIVASPPYSQSNVGNGDGENELRRLQKKAAAGQLRGEHLRLANQGRLSPHENANLDHYGQTPGQLAALPPGAATTLTELENEMTDNWQNCYDDGWKGLIVDEAFAHPAKFSRGLIFRIVKHLLDENMLRPGDTVVDPFGGVGLGGLACMQNGLNWVGCELESKFVELGQANIDLWNARYAAHFPRWGSAQLLQGDSRRLAEVVSAAGCVVSSPPFTQSLSSGQFSDEAIEELRRNGHKPGPAGNAASYGQTPGQLAALPPGQPPAGLITSPPFAGNTGGRGEASRNGIDAALFDRHGGGMKGGTGSDPANLDNLRMGAVVGSPPFENSLDRGTVDKQMRVDYARKNGIDTAAKVSPIDMEKIGGRTQPDYGNTPNQLGQDSGETFWTAARLIVEQCALLLPPGAPAVWVTKRYVKNGKVVEFSQQWAALCEACGFEVVHWHRAMLVKDNGTQTDLFGGNGRSNKTERKSFFRRLSEAGNKADRHWEALSRAEQAEILWQAHNETWRNYFIRLALFELPAEDKEKAGVKIDMDAPPRPRRNKIFRDAKSIAWARDGKPDYEIETAIDWEDVICTVRRPA